MEIITSSEFKTEVKTWLPLDEIEAGALEQIRNAAKHPEVGAVVAVMPDCHVGFGVAIGCVFPTVNAVLPNAVGVDIGCFTGDTLVPLLDGTVQSLLALSQRPEPFWVYSIDKQGMISPGRAIAGRTRRDAELVEVIVSGGRAIRCTPDHEFLLRDGSYKRASELSIGQSLMPLYRSYETRDGKEHVKHPGGKSEATHRMVARIFGIKGEHIHHHDGRFWNNAPENLVPLSAREHSSLTARSHMQFTRREFKEKRLAALRESDFFSRNAERMAEVGARNLAAAQINNPEAFARNYADAGNRGRAQVIKNNVTPRACEFCSAVLPNLAAWRWHQKKEHNNHKVISVRRLAEREDVYCLSVEEHHNFALDAGVFVHNCGMCAVNTGVALDRARMDKRFWRAWAGQVARDVPTGFSWHETPQALGELDRELKAASLQRFITEKAAVQLGTLGGGNHFLEAQVDETGLVWLMVHSGSRNTGLQIANHYHKLAVEQSRARGLDAGKDLSSLLLDDQLGQDYLSDMQWATDFALASRKAMIGRMLAAFQHLVDPLNPEVAMDAGEFINIHHNFAQLEEHGGTMVMVHRKGATSADAGQLGIIPGSMGAKSYIVRGLGNEQSLKSCSHGADRRMGRNVAKKSITETQFAASLEGTYSKASMNYVDEAPLAYKDIETVIARQMDLIEVVHALTPIMTVKGDSRAKED